ncbi:hypothetical protein TRFO_20509 [Tritrichomonas foetus]|uniref:Uncharacterized protein n=1 Tax=Tritrichomonas foetus TaxID=1144522 RepID=A0A1J4KGN1_9EUKA|nr:hypothetical protein TRFO_20509 [Tritrichomonas foetus]|eukprot:OHT10218.1 hypothetical protein TRFO_20509 [Tritrichomonas foetus]
MINLCFKIIASLKLNLKLGINFGRLLLTLRWKTKRQELSREQKDALMELQDRHEIEHRQLEKEWSQPHVLRKFSKRSPNMLQNLQKEKYMLLIGEYEGAEQMKKINAQLEKAETLDRKQEMMNSFLAAQSNLISRQKSELTRLISEQTKKLDLLNEFERKDIEVKVKRLTVTQSFLDEEKDFNKFVAKKYKRPASCIVPNTVMASRDAPQDLPPLPRGKLVPHTVSDLLAVRKRAIVTPLPLPPFAVRKYKIQRVRASQ